jgi:serine protease Do
MKRLDTWQLLAFLSCMLIGGSPLGALAQRADPGSAPARAQVNARLSAARRNVITAAAERVSPAVVTVSVEATRMVRVAPFGGLFRDPFFDQFMPSPEQAQRISGLGSGVIVDASGVVLTNEHVVRDAEKVSITLPDGRQFPAEVLGGSPAYDLAVLRVKGGRLPAAPLGHSDDLVVGEWAIAIGNPFGNLLESTEPTVTAGVISATNRDIKGGATQTGVYKHMIQTDAAINPGNSGGALVNADGDVIGINTFILSGSGGSVGIGFAIPIDLARRVLDEVTRYGRVRVAWPGMQVQVVDGHLAQQLGWPDEGGMVVTQVEPEGPAAKAGVQVRDRIRKVNGRAVDSVDDIQVSVYGRFVGDSLTLTIEREGRALIVPLVLAEAPRSAE